MSGVYATRAMHNACTTMHSTYASGRDRDGTADRGGRPCHDRPVRRRESRRDRMRASHGFAAPRLRRTAVSARRHLGRLRGERRGLLRPRHRGSSSASSTPRAGARPTGSRCPSSPTRSGTATSPTCGPASSTGCARTGLTRPRRGTASIRTSSSSTPTPARSRASCAGTTRSTATGSAARRPISPSTAATAPGRCRSAGSSTPPTPGAPTAAPRRGWAETVIYEAHVKGMTAEPPGDRRPARRHLRGARLAAGGRAPG